MLVVVGGHSRNIGKTSVVAGLIRKLRGFRWTAAKITLYGNDVCAHDGGGCGCEPASGEAFELTEEYTPNDTDTGRFLAAGAERSFWLRAPAGEQGLALSKEQLAVHVGHVHIVPPLRAVSRGAH